MASRRFILRRLAFTGPGKDIRDVDFVPGFNVVWGGSQAGKTFMVKALDYMFGGGSALPTIPSATGYDRCWLELDLPESGRVTLARSMSKGGFDLFPDTIDNSLGRQGNRTLAANHGGKTESISSFLLGELGIGEVEIARTLSGEKSAFTIRHFASYMFTEETPMIAETSPITISEKSGDTFNKNVLKFILTGADDKAIVKVPDTKEQKQTNAGRIEIVEEMLNAATSELAAMYPGVDIDTLNLDEQSERLEETVTAFRDRVVASYSKLDELIRERRLMTSERDELVDRAEETALTIGRFNLLSTSYDSDVKRLIALEEGAAALMVGAKRTCVLCGADPEHQHVEHGFEAVETSQAAVSAELRKVRAESAGLVKATASLEAEQLRLMRRVETLSREIARKSDEIDEVRIIEAKAREDFDEIDKARRRLSEALSIQRRIHQFKVRRDQLSAFKAKSVPRDNIVVGVGTVVGDQLAAAVEKIFKAWRYPGEPRIAFNEKTHDILLNGSQRNANGKGVRALLNAAFKIGVMDVCRLHGVPHPGIITLDSPLLSYRDPMTSRYGELSADEKEVASAGLKVHFYDYLIKRADEAQFIIIENQDPPYELPPDTREHVFAGEHGTGPRRGLF